LGERAIVTEGADRDGESLRTLRPRLLPEVTGEDAVDCRGVAQIAGQSVAQEPFGRVKATAIDGLVFVGEKKEEALLVVVEKELKCISPVGRKVLRLVDEDRVGPGLVPSRRR
jgi:hypothetical protein